MHDCWLGENIVLMENEARFSHQLIERLRLYFKEEYDVDVSPESADIFLGSLARVYQALTQEGPLSPSI